MGQSTVSQLGYAARVKLRLVTCFLVVGACRTTPPPQALPPPTPSPGSLGALTTRSDESEPDTGATLNPAPPVDLLLPRGVTVVDVTDGGGKASFDWRGWFAGNPSDARLLERIALRHDEGVLLSATAAAFELYREELDAAGYSITTYGPSLSMPLSEGERPLEGMVQLRPANPDNPYDPKQEVIEVLVGPRGG